MKRIKINIFFLTALSFFLTHKELQAQQTSSDQEKIERLLEIKKEMSKDDAIGDRYRIQLFYGDNGEADEIIKEYREKYDYSSTITYDSPNYKVLIGDFRNRLEADRALSRIKEDFPSAFIPKPRRK